MIINLIRHAATLGNVSKKYIGASDEPICDDGKRELEKKEKDREADYVYVSPMTRARQSAGVLFPNATQIVVNDLREMDFGIFEGKSHKELLSDDRYINWLESGCELHCPGGESKADFTERVCAAFKMILSKEADRGSTRVNIVAHGGTIMAICSETVTPKRDYYEWHVKNGEVISLEFVGSFDKFPKYEVNWRRD